MVCIAVAGLVSCQKPPCGRIYLLAAMAALPLTTPLEPSDDFQSRSRDCVLLTSPIAFKKPASAVKALGGSVKLSQSVEWIRNPAAEFDNSSSSSALAAVKAPMLRPRVDGDPYSHGCVGEPASSAPVNAAVVRVTFRRQSGAQPSGSAARVSGAPAGMVARKARVLAVATAAYDFYQPADFQFLPSAPPTEVSADYINNLLHRNGGGTSHPHAPSSDDDSDSDASGDGETAATPSALHRRRKRRRLGSLASAAADGKGRCGGEECMLVPQPTFLAHPYAASTLGDFLRRDGRGMGRLSQLQGAKAAGLGAVPVRGLMNEEWYSFDFASDAPVPAPRDTVQPEWAHVVSQVQAAFDERPIWTVPQLTRRFPELSKLEPALHHVAYHTNKGVWRLCWFRRGYDPRTDPASITSQVIDVRLKHDIRAIMDRNKHLMSTEHSRPVFAGTEIAKQGLWRLADLPALTDTDGRNVDINALRSDSFHPRYGWFTTGGLRTMRATISRLLGEAVKRWAAEAGAVAAPVPTSALAAGPVTRVLAAGSGVGADASGAINDGPLSAKTALQQQPEPAAEGAGETTRDVHEAAAAEAAAAAAAAAQAAATATVKGVSEAVGFALRDDDDDDSDDSDMDSA